MLKNAELEVLKFKADIVATSTSDGGTGDITPPTPED